MANQWAMALNFGDISLNEQKTGDPSLHRKLKSVTCGCLWLCADQITYTSAHQCFCNVFRQWECETTPKQQSACSLLNKKVKWVNDIKYKTLNTNAMTRTSHMHGSNNWNHLIKPNGCGAAWNQEHQELPKAPGRPRAYLFSCSWLVVWEHTNCSHKMNQ